MADVIFAVDDIERLRVPPLDSYVGGSDPEWVELSCSAVPLLIRRPKLRMPVSGVFAKWTRRWVRFGPVVLLANVLVIYEALWQMFFDERLYLGYVWLDPEAMGLLAITVVFFSALWRSHNRPYSAPVRIPGRRVVVPNLPMAVAKEWVELNPGTVRIVDERILLRTFRPWVYVVAALPCAALGLALLATATIQHDPDSRVTWLTAFLLVALGPALLWRSLPARFQPRPQGR